jgi:bifunctional non-homologous end joining protein LigD
MTDTIPIGRRQVPFSHPDKALFSDPEITKRALAEHYENVAEAMLPHIRDRPLALQAFPKGIDGDGFFLKSVPRHFPDWITTVTVPKKGGTLTQVVANEAATLVYLVGQNVVTPHIWLSRGDEPRQPDRLIIDFDPSPGVTFADVRAAARDAGERLRDAGLATFAMVTGSRGVHVVSPLRRGPSFGDVHTFTRAVAEAMVADDPDHLTLEWHREERGARIYVDVNRINYAQHAVAPYGVRPRPRGPVAMPIAWDELSDSRLAPDKWTVATAADRLRSEGDQWKGIARQARKLPSALPG